MIHVFFNVKDYAIHMGKDKNCLRFLLVQWGGADPMAESPVSSVRLFFFY